MKTIYLYILDTMADWEVGYALAELNSQRYFKERKDWQVKTCATRKRPITTLGGVTITPDYVLDEVDTKDAAMIILPGADIWMNPTQVQAIDKVKQFLADDVPVASICGSTSALAEAGILNDNKHTSNSLQYLQMFCTHYEGAVNYKNELAVTDGNLITAGSSAPIEFAYHIFKKLNVFDAKSLEHWYNYFAKHSTDDLMLLMQSVAKGK